jgi:RimJ/RimL family protein N-acetyltransferase
MMKPILHDFPHSFESERLLLQAPQPGDGQVLNEAILESLAALRPWMPWAAGDPPTVAENEAWVRERQAAFLQREDLPLFLFLKDSRTFIGGSGLHRIDWSVPKFEIGYWVRTAYEGHGYITEAVRRIVNFAIDELDARRIEIRCDARNERSAAVAHRVGFVHEATLHQARRDHLSGTLQDTLVFAHIISE